nr:hypothetical protein [Desulfobacula sp.]
MKIILNVSRPTSTTGNETRYESGESLSSEAIYTYDLSYSNLLSACYPGNVTDTYEYDVLKRVIFKSEQGVENNANNQVIAMTNI